MQILNGIIKGRKIESPRKARLVQSRVKKAVFDILRGELAGKRVLDLFAGSGALGLECLSRGAEHALFVEESAEALAVINKNLVSLGLSGKAGVFAGDAFAAIKEFSIEKMKFDLIFADPPYHQVILRKSLQCIMEYDILAPSGFVIGFSFSKDQPEPEDILPAGWEKALSRKYGDTRVIILSRK
jgi:16S rRNA (guanine(966)-N(2))-methyltransferase RsmD